MPIGVERNDSVVAAHLLLKKFRLKKDVIKKVCIPSMNYLAPLHAGNQTPEIAGS